MSGAMSGSSIVRCTAIRPSFFTKSCWRLILPMSAVASSGLHRSPVAGSYVPLGSRISRCRARTHCSADAPLRW